MNKLLSSLKSLSSRPFFRMHDFCTILLRHQWRNHLMNYLELIWSSASSDIREDWSRSSKCAMSSLRTSIEWPSSETIFFTSNRSLCRALTNGSRSLDLMSTYLLANINNDTSRAGRTSDCLLLIEWPCVCWPEGISNRTAAPNALCRRTHIWPSRHQLRYLE